MLRRLLFLIPTFCFIVSCAHQGAKQAADSAPAEVTPEADNREPAQQKITNLMDQANNTKYDVLFTDPECKRYVYSEPVKDKSGAQLLGKPKNVYCRNKNDAKTSGERPSSPQYRLLEWVNDPTTKEIIFTYLSFRNKAVKSALCERVKKNEIRVTFVMSSSEDTTIANEVKACNPERVDFKTRGLENELGYAHNKIFIVLQKSNFDLTKTWRSQIGSSDRVKIAFSSGNMTSGPLMHHENWHFIETRGSTHFAQMHLCTINTEWDEATGHHRDKYMAGIRSCREDLVKKGFPQENDIKVFFVPGEGQGYQGTLDNGHPGKSASEHMIFGDGSAPGIRNADGIYIGAHRFFYSKMISALNARMASGNKPDLRITVDDDTYFKATDSEFHVGDTDPSEWSIIEDMVGRGAQVRLMETNHDEHQLHHSKYLLFLKKGSAGLEPKSLLCGAANLTGAGFTKNWENIYFITIPSVLKSFHEHYLKFWSTSTEPFGMKEITSKATPMEALPEKGMVGELLVEQN